MAHYAFPTDIFFRESQRDSVPQPRIAAAPLPWEMRYISESYPEGAASIKASTDFNRRNPVGVVFSFFQWSQGSPASGRPALG